MQIDKTHTLDELGFKYRLINQWPLWRPWMHWLHPGVSSHLFICYYHYCFVVVVRGFICHSLLELWNLYIIVSSRQITLWLIFRYYFMSLGCCVFWCKSVHLSLQFQSLANSIIPLASMKWTMSGSAYKWNHTLLFCARFLPLGIIPFIFIYVVANSSFLLIMSSIAFLDTLIHGWTFVCRSQLQ